MAKKQSGIILTESDWGEIYYALESKRLGINRGYYGPEDQPGDDEKWVDHLDSIEEKIGPDGKKAAKQGVLKARKPTGPGVNYFSSRRREEKHE